MLLDPLEEQLHLPALVVQVVDQLRFEREVVGQKHQALAAVVLDYHPARRRRAVLVRKMLRQHTRLIAQHRRTRACALGFTTGLSGVANL